MLAYLAYLATALAILGCIVTAILSSKVRAIAICVVAMLIAIVVLPGLGRAEEVETIELEAYIVTPVMVDGEPCLRIDFGYHGETLSLYWDGELDTSFVLVVELWGEECVDAYYAE